MAWHFLDRALKVRLKIDPDVAAKRIFTDNADMRERFSDLETAMQEVNNRKQSEVERYKTLYGVDIGDDNNFDLVINTSRKSQEEVLSEFEAAFDAYKKHLDVS